MVRRFSRMVSGERVFRLMVPPREAAPVSGRCPLVSSSASNIVPVMLCSWNVRLVFTLGSTPPSIVTELSCGSMPRMLNQYASPSSVGLPATPGNRITTSPALMLGRLPKESIATMFFTFSALRCCVIAAASPSRSPVTLNASIL